MIKPSQWYTSRPTTAITPIFPQQTRRVNRTKRCPTRCFYRLSALPIIPQRRGPHRSLPYCHVTFHATVSASQYLEHSHVIAPWTLLPSEVSVEREREWMRGRVVIFRDLPCPPPHPFKKVKVTLLCLFAKNRERKCEGSCSFFSLYLHLTVPIYLFPSLSTIPSILYTL